MFSLDLDPSGLILITDESGYRLVLRPIGPTAELLCKILIERKMGHTKLGEGGAPTQAQVFNTENEMARLRQERAREAIAASPINMELDI